MAASPKKTTAKTSKTLKAGASAKATTKPVTAPKAGPGGASQSSAPAAAVAAPAVVEAPKPVMIGPAMRKKEIVDDVVARSGLKKRDVKPVVDHLLAVLGDAVSEGRELVIPPLGRIKVHKKKEAAKKTINFAKIHRNLPAKPDSTGA